jgi:regulator of protease activity HflC (stomatin/prohibitin superfamily)
MQQSKSVLGYASIVVGIPIAVALIVSSLSVIGAGQRGVVVLFGQISGVIDPGIHLLNPLSDVVKINVQTQKETASATAASSDLQNVTATIALNYHINPTGVAALYTSVGKDVVSKIIDPSLQDSIKAATAKYTAEQLITKRQEVSDLILANVHLAISERAKGDYVGIDAIAITNFEFSDSFNSAIEAKVTAEQNALAAKNKLQQVEYERDQRIAQAEGEAKAIAIQAQAINSQGGADYVHLKAIEKWDGVLPAQFVPGSAVPFIEIK